MAHTNSDCFPSDIVLRCIRTGKIGTDFFCYKDWESLGSTIIIVIIIIIIIVVFAISHHPSHIRFPRHFLGFLTPHLGVFLFPLPPPSLDRLSQRWSLVHRQQCESHDALDREYRDGMYSTGEHRRGQRPPPNRTPLSFFFWHSTSPPPSNAVPRCQPLCRPRPEGNDEYEAFTHTRS
jgi:hypothetical protein